MIMLAPRTFAVICGADTTVQEVLYAGFSGVPGLKSGMSLAELVDRDSRGKLANLVKTIQLNGIAVIWQLDLVLEEKLETLTFSGARLAEGLLIMAARLQDDALAMAQEIAGSATSPELRRTALRLTNQLRSLLHSQSEECDALTDVYNEVTALHRRLAKQTVQLTEANRLKSLFVGMAAHDLRNPLSNIMQLARFLAEDEGPESSDRVEFSRTIEQLSHAMLNLIEDLLDISAIEHGQINLNREEVMLTEIAEESVSRFSSMARPHRISVRLLTPATPVPVYADPGKMRQVIDNLLDNAIKHAPEGSTVTVALSRSNDGSVILSVADEGPGIPRAAMDTLFVPFHPGVSTGRGNKSRGLGLAIVKRLVEAHEGVIRVDTSPESGTRFCVSLPAQPLTPAVYDSGRSGSTSCLIR